MLKLGINSMMNMEGWTHIYPESAKAEINDHVLSRCVFVTLCTSDGYSRTLSPLFHNQSAECQQNLIGLRFNFNFGCPLCVCLCERWFKAPVVEWGGQHSAHILLGIMYWKRHRSMEERRGFCPLLPNDFQLLVYLLLAQHSDCFMYKS